MKNGKFRYYVSYFWANDLTRTNGQGFQCIERDCPICGYEDIASIVTFIEELNTALGKVVIINWHRFEAAE